MLGVATRVFAVVVGMTVLAAASPAAELGAAYTAYDRGDLDGAAAALARADERAIVNKDYLWWLRGMVALRGGDPDAAQKAFERLGKLGSAKYGDQVPWRLADCQWARGDRAGAAKAYARIVDAKGAAAAGDVGTALYRIAETRSGPAAAAALRTFLLGYPAHPLAGAAEARLAELGGAPLAPLERIERAKKLTDAHLWDEAVAEISLIGTPATAELRRQRDYWLGITLFKVRRRYDEAGKLLLGVYKGMGPAAAEAMFHGARALSRADKDDEAIEWYKKVVAAYPDTVWAQEAAFLAGWLEFNAQRYKQAIPALEASLARYPKTKWVDDALWYLGLSHYFLGEWDKARARLVALSKYAGAYEGGKGLYWIARVDEKLGAKAAAAAGYTATVKAYPFSWYALLARSRLKAAGTTVPPFGVAAPKPRGPRLSATVDEGLATDDLIARADELIAAGMVADAGMLLARGEPAFLGRHAKADALAMLMDRYRKAGNFHRPWMIAVSYHGGALNGPPEGDARRWWEHAYPRAYRELVEKYQRLGNNPDDYLYAIMRKESGFNPHDLSFADAQGLLQMIPPTTKRVAKELGIPYDEGRLYEPEYNIQTGSWYIGRVLGKFKGQIPLGAGSFNSGPRPVMKWVDKFGDREMDELVELVPFRETREYMKMATDFYARYRYLYANELYEQPLVVDRAYVQDRLTY
ncbi:MAG: transglycosylase SLT domain-containing protein [Deltaproteobacteria bacterium]|nr:transglycosylase SLT domain-containing protein [Deltaproteobacteria bacterium]